MAPGIQQVAFEALKAGSEQEDEESVHQGDDEQELAAGLPLLQARGLEGELGFFKAQGHFDLPPPSIQENDAPGIFGGANGFIGEEEPGLFAGTRARDDEPQGDVREIGMMDGAEEDAHGAPATARRIPNGAMIDGTFPGHQFSG